MDDRHPGDKRVKNSAQNIIYSNIYQEISSTTLAKRQIMETWFRLSGHTYSESGNRGK